MIREKKPPEGAIFAASLLKPPALLPTLVQSF